VPPLRSIDETVKEMRWGKEHGAVGIFMKGIERDKTLDDPYFFPVYEEASKLDLPICIHTAAGCPAWTNVFTIERNSSFPHIRLLPLVAFRDLVHNRIPEQFPKVRWGFIEAGASWVPYILDDYWARHDRQSAPDMAGRKALGLDKRTDLFATSRFFVAYQVQEDLQYLLDKGLEDCLVIGTDYTHADQSADIGMLRAMQDRAARGEVNPTVVRKMLDDNPRRLYGF
jgi:uncharacterized protein